MVNSPTQLRHCITLWNTTDPKRITWMIVCCRKESACERRTRTMLAAGRYSLLIPRLKCVRHVLMCAMCISWRVGQKKKTIDIGIRIESQLLEYTSVTSVGRFMENAPHSADWAHSANSFYECIILTWTLNYSFFFFHSYHCHRFGVGFIFYALTPPARRRRVARHQHCRTRRTGARARVWVDKCVNEFVRAPFKYLSVNRKIIVN